MNAKILIADDESDIVSMLGSFFESKGFRVLPGDLTIDYSERCLFFGDKRVGLAKKRNLILWNCFLKIRDRSLIKNGFMSVFGVMTARATAALWQSISAGYEQRLRHIQTGYILKQFGGADING